jgi:putative cobalt transporter subunit CbtA
VTAYLRRGALAGLAGGAAMAVFLLAVGERSIRQALAIEAARSQGEPGLEEFSRGTQLAGGVAAALLYGLFIGAVFAVVFAAVRHRSRLGDDFARSLGLAAIGFATLVLVPALKYPANPPAVGDPDTVNQRTVAYLTLVGLSVVASLAAWRLSRYLRAQGLADHQRLPLVGLGYVALVGIAFLAWPANPDAITVPAQLIWRFRLAALGGAATLWAVMAVVFGWASLRSAASDRPAAVAQALR